jgi:hypothetical protein
LLIVRELMFGPQRFTDLRGGLSGASPNVLSQRLRELEAAGVIPTKSGELRATYELRLGEQRFAVEIEGAAIAINRGAARKADAMIETDAATLRAVVLGDQKLSDDTPVQVQGDRRLAVHSSVCSLALVRTRRRICKAMFTLGTVKRR